MKKVIPTKPLNTENFFVSEYMSGLASQRERFKSAKIHGEYDMMADILENIKSELKIKSITKGRGEKIRRIEAILDWYRRKERRYMVRTPNGIAVRYPVDMPQRINHNLTLCYELLVVEMEKLNLL